jgi:hypothetical protein
MKRLLFLICTVPLLVMMACSDDDNLPQFDVEIVFSDDVQVNDNVITIPQGDVLSIESVKPVNSTAKEITFGTVTYQIDGGAGLSTLLQPYSISFNTSGMSVGRHLLRIFITVWAVDYSPANAIVTYYIDVTEPSADGDGSTDADDSDTNTPVTTVVTFTPEMVSK